MQCAFAINYNGSANATKYICSSGTLPVTWNGYVNAESQFGRNSTYFNSQYSRLHVNSAGIYVSKTAKWSSGKNKGDKQKIDIPYYKYLTISYKGATPVDITNGSTSGTEYASNNDAVKDWDFSIPAQDNNTKKKMTGSAGGVRNYYFQKGSGTEETPVTATFKIQKKNKKGNPKYKNKYGSYQGSSTGTFTFNVPPAEVKVQYNVNGGSKYAEYTVNSAGTILKNGSAFTSSGAYGAVISSKYGVLNVDKNCRPGYYLTSGQEWNTKSNGSGTSFGMDDTSLKYSQIAKAMTSTVKDMTVTLYANWKPNQYTINYNSNGGNGSMSSQSISYGDGNTISQNSFTRSRYSFTGWNTKSDGSGTSYKSGDSASITSVSNGGNITLYAQWKQLDHISSLTYNVDGGSLSSTLTNTYSLNSNWIMQNGTQLKQTASNSSTAIKIFPAPSKSYASGDITKFGYSLPKGAEWIDKSTGSTYAAGGTYYSSSFGNENVALTANWKVVQGKLTISPGTGQFANGSTSSIVINNGVIQARTTNYDISSLVSGINKANYTLLGFYDSSGNLVYDKNGKCVNTSPYWKNNVYQGTGDLTVTAKYKENVSYVISYDKNSKDATGTMDSTNIYTERGGTLRDCTFTRDGYRFVGWNTKANGSGDFYQNQEEMDTVFSSYELDSDGNEVLVNKTAVTLYAQWKSATGARYDTQTVRIPNTPEELPKSNHIMIGVKKVDEETGKSVSDAEFTLTDDVTNTSYKGTSDQEGVVTFSGITELNSRDGSAYTYTLDETKYPKGYSSSAYAKMPYKISITRVKNDDGTNDYTLNVKVTDSEGKNVTLIPSDEDSSGVSQVYVVVRNKSSLKTLKLTKTDETKVEKLAGVTFTLTGVDVDYSRTVKTDTNGALKFTDLENGTYKLREDATIAGYALSKETYTVTVSDSGIKIEKD